VIGNSKLDVVIEAVIQPGFVPEMFVSLVDGLGLEWCIEPKLLSAKDAREACFKLLEPILGSLQ
jgi:hypothetical protein